MDTRTKILSRAADLPPAERLVLVTGHFDVIRADHVREFAKARETAGDSTLVAVVVEGPEALLPMSARGELVAAIRMVDYVLTAANEDVEVLIETLKPAAVVRLESDDARRLSALKEHVHRRQS